MMGINSFLILGNSMFVMTACNASQNLLQRSYLGFVSTLRLGLMEANRFRVGPGRHFRVIRETMASSSRPKTTTRANLNANRMATQRIVTPGLGAWLEILQSKAFRPTGPRTSLLAPHLPEPYQVFAKVSSFVL